MSKDRSYDLRDIRVSREPEQFCSLLPESIVDDDENGPTPAWPSPPFSQSSLSQAAPNGSSQTPRTIHRVRFDIRETTGGEHALNDHARASRPEDGNWPEAEDDGSAEDSEIRRNSVGQRAPLLTGVEAPSVMVAEDLDFNDEGLLENARPKSGLMYDNPTMRLW